MKKRFASLFLLLVLFGSAFAGMPLHFGESDCGMSGMMDMDCCKAALMQEHAPKFSEEELLCALNCAQNGATLPSGLVRVTPPAQTIQPPHPALTEPRSIPLSVSTVTTQTHSPPGSAPTYLRNLALLI
ncbi:MAG: hypothetical protein ACRD9S_05245 [Pyrinomonadaceae bacterium]